MLELVAGGFVINGAHPRTFFHRFIGKDYLVLSINMKVKKKTILWHLLNLHLVALVAITFEPIWGHLKVVSYLDWINCWYHSAEVAALLPKPIRQESVSKILDEDHEHLITKSTSNTWFKNENRIATFIYLYLIFNFYLVIVGLLDMQKLLKMYTWFILLSLVSKETITYIN